MKVSTTVWLGVRHIGDKESDDIIIEASVSEALKEIVRFVTSTHMRGRFDLTIARTVNDLHVGLRREAKNVDSANDLLAFIDSIEGGETSL